MEHYPAPFSQEKVKHWSEWNIRNYEDYNHGLWSVILKDSGELVGDCGITMQTIADETVPEIGFHISKNHWNRGYATEAANACLDYAFEVLKYPRVFSYTTLSNLPSRKVAEKMGMQTYKLFEKNREKMIAQVAFNEKGDHI